MITWIKRLFGAAPAEPDAVVDLSTATLGEIIDENLRLGVEVDRLQERRQALTQRAAALRAGD